MSPTCADEPGVPARRRGRRCSSGRRRRPAPAGPATGSATGNGAYPRDRRTGSRSPSHDPDHRVVAGHVDRPVVPEPGVGETGQPGQGLVVVGDDRLAGQVAAGHHQHRGPGGRRAVRTAAGAPACTAASPRGRGCPGRRFGATAGAAGLRRSSTIGRRLPVSSSLLGGIDHGDPPGRVQVGGHHRERLVARGPCACAGWPTAAWSRGVAGQVVAAESFDREDRAVDQQRVRAPQARSSP